MPDKENCRTCGGKLIIRQTQKKPAQLKKAYYYTAYYYCPACQKIYHDDKFKVVNNISSLFDGDMDSRLLPTGRQVRGNDGGKGGNDNIEAAYDKNSGKKLNNKFDVEIWTDGACVFNGQHNARAAWAFVSGTNEEAGRVPGDKQTNNVAEGLAILKAIEWAVKSNFKKIKIYTDSQITIYNLKKPAVQIKQNREIFSDIEKLINQNNLKIHYEKVLGHSGDVNNERADRLANELASSH